VLVVRPHGFAWNQETAATNVAARVSGRSAGVAGRARREVDALASALAAAGVAVRRVEDTSGLPDAAFANNWLSFHGDRAVLYPMATPSRRAEVRRELVAGVREILDLTPWADEGLALEGTGSLVLDTTRRVAFACLSPRTHLEAVRRWCEKMEFRPVVFEAELAGKPPYHTNVVLSLVHGVALAALPLVTAGRAELERELSAFRVVSLEAGHVERFCGNVLGLAGRRPVAAMSSGAWAALGDAGRGALANLDVVHVPLPTIEGVGGGSARCLLVEEGSA
jgi:hypothetical protein